MSQLIHDNLGPSGIFKGKKVLELGSGTGLGGLIAANYADEVILTDYQDTIMKLLSMNINLETKNAKCTYAMLDWLKITQDNYYNEIQLFDKNDQ